MDSEEKLIQLLHETLVELFFSKWECLVRLVILKVSDELCIEEPPGIPISWKKLAVHREIVCSFYWMWLLQQMAQTINLNISLPSDFLRTSL